MATYLIDRVFATTTYVYIDVNFVTTGIDDYVIDLYCVKD